MELLLTGFMLSDGTGRDPLPHAALHVRDGRIAWVGALSDLPASVRPAVQHDLTGRTMIPGLIDAHVHVSWNGREAVSQLIHRSRDQLLLEAVGTVRDILASGTTTVRDVGGHDYFEMALRWAIDSGRLPGPRMRTSGKIITMTGGHGHYIACEADGPDELRKAARAQIKAGADTIKLMATGGISTPGQDVEACQFTLEEMAAAVGAAHAMGRTAAAHCHGAAGIKNAVLAGMDSIEHGSYLDEEAADLMVERGTALVFTLKVARPEAKGLSPEARAEAERLQAPLTRLRARVRESVALAREKGLFIGAGSDGGGNPLSPHRFSMANELAELVDHGFTPLEAITVITQNNARILRWDTELGTLEPGKWADLVVLRGNPLDDITQVRTIETVYKGGEPIAPLTNY